MRRLDVLALLALAVAVGAFFGPAIFGDRAVFTWNMDRWQPWRSEATAEDVARPTRLSDCARQFAVMRALATDAARDDRIPLWNRWIYCGTPFLANFQPGVFYPPNIPLALSGLSVPDQMTAYLALHLFVAVAGTYVLLRSFRLGPGPSLLGAIVSGWSGYNAARTGLPTMVATGAWLPWALAASRRWFAREDGRSFAGMAGALAMSGLAGFAQIFVFTAYSWGLFGLIEGLARRPRLRARRWIGWTAAGALGLSLVGVHLLPTVEFMGLGQDSTNTAEMLESGTLHPWVLGKIVVPDLLGHPADETNATHLLPVGSGYYFQTEHSTAVYVGLLPLLLAAIVLLAPGDHRRVAAVGLSLAALGLLWCMRTPLTALGPWIPGLGFSRPDRAAFVWCFGAAIVAAVGLERLAGPEGPSMRRPTNRFALVVGAALLAFAVLVASVPDVLPADVVARVGRGRISGAAAATALTCVAALAVIGLRAAGRLRPGACVAAALALCAVDLGWYAMRLNMMQPEASIFRAPVPGDAVDFLQRRREADGAFRILRYERDPTQFDGVLPPSTASLYGIEDALGFDSINLATYQEFMAALDPTSVLKRGHFRGVCDATTLASPLVDLLNVRWVLTEERGELPGVIQVRDGPVSIHENPDALPRAFLVGEVRTIQDPAARLEALADPSFRPDLWAYAEEPIPELTSPAPGRPGEARLLTHEDERVVVAVDAARPALLVLSDAWYPGWRATVDAQPRTIHRVDHVFRGVAVAPGDREVEFRYEPASFRAGAATSGVAIVLLAACAFWLQRTRP
jgi:hypothetical protein